MDKLRCLIVEDEYPSVELLKEYIEQMPNELTFVSSCDNARDAHSILSKQAIDILFLDLQLSGSMTGLDLLHILNDISKQPNVVITSGDSEGILEAIEFRPSIMRKGTRSFSFDHFKAIVLEFYKKHQLAYPPLEPTASLVSPPIAASTEPSQQFIVLKNTHGHIRVNVDDVKYVKADSGMAVYHFDNGETLQVWDSLKKISTEVMPEGSCCRAHDKYIMGSKRFFQKAEWADRRLTLTDGTVLPIGDTYLRELKDYILES